MCKKKKVEIKKGDECLHIGEGLYKTQDGHVVRFINIDAYFEIIGDGDVKSSISHDMMRTLLIEQCYQFQLDTLINSKFEFEHSMQIRLNHLLNKNYIACSTFEIEQVEQVYSSVR